MAGARVGKEKWGWLACACWQGEVGVTGTDVRREGGWRTRWQGEGRGGWRARSVGRGWLGLCNGMGTGQGRGWNAGAGQERG